MSTKSRKARSGSSSGLSYAEIARAAGVSPGLISAFFSGNHYSAERKSGIGISPVKRRKIIDTCRKLQYVPDTPYAFYRIYPEKADVGVVLNDDVGLGFSNPHHSLLFEGLALRAQECGVDLVNLFFNGGYDYLIRPEVIPNAIQNGSVCKLAITGRPNYSLVYRLLKMDVSFVLVGHSIPMDGIVSVVPDYFEASRSAIHTLHQHGHRSIAVVAYELGPRPDSYNGHELRRGVDQAFAELGLPIHSNNLFTMHGGFSKEDIIKVFERMPEHPTAVFCFDDNIARNLIHVLENAGFSVPGHISVLGCNDDRINQEVHPGVSTMHFPSIEIGKRAFDELTRVSVEGRPSSYTNIVLPASFLDKGTIRTLFV